MGCKIHTLQQMQTKHFFHMHASTSRDKNYSQQRLSFKCYCLNRLVNKTLSCKLREKKLKYPSLIPQILFMHFIIMSIINRSQQGHAMQKEIKQNLGLNTMHTSQNPNKKEWKNKDKRNKSLCHRIQQTTKRLCQTMLPSSTGHIGGTVGKTSQVHSSGNQPCFLEFWRW